MPRVALLDSELAVPDQMGRTVFAAMMKQRQRVPMMRVVKEQPKKLIEVNRYTDLNRTRYAQPW